MRKTKSYKTNFNSRKKLTAKPKYPEVRKIQSEKKQEIIQIISEKKRVIDYKEKYNKERKIGIDVDFKNMLRIIKKIKGVFFMNFLQFKYLKKLNKKKSDE